MRKSKEHHVWFDEDDGDCCIVSCSCGWHTMEETRQDADDAHSDHIAGLYEV